MDTNRSNHEEDVPHATDESAFKALAAEELELASGGTPTPDDDYYRSSPAGYDPFYG